MIYPLGLSSDQKNRIERARDVAELALRKQLKEHPGRHLDSARDFIFSVFRVLSKEMAAAERDGVFSGSEGRQTLLYFVEAELVPHAYKLAGVENVRIQFYPFSVEQFRARVLELLQDSELWTQYLTERLKAWAEVPGRQVTAALVSRRKRLVAEYRKKAGMSFADLARHWAMSDSAIRGVIREDRSRFNGDSQSQMLQKLGVTIDDWYKLR